MLGILYICKMLSVSNLNWILYECMLKQCMLDAWYAFPLGSLEHLSQHEFINVNTHQRNMLEPRQNHHVFFHFEQEPLWTDHFGFFYDCIIDGAQWTTKRLRLLANSEHSAIKKQICKDRHMQDWYFFYHGFAALDWFRDGQYVVDDNGFDKVFSSFNHLVRDKRAYRMSLTSQLISAGLHRFGDISFHGTQIDCKLECDSRDSFLSDTEKHLVSNSLGQMVHLPLKIDSDYITGDFSAHYGHREHRLWQRSFWHLVNETVFYDQKLHLTEKVFKPIVASRPFILVAAPGNLAYLKNYGFKTFEHWIDETYDQVSDPEKRLKMICVEIDKLCALSRSQLQRMHNEMLPILEHNRQHFFGQFRKIIVDELVDNFDACIRVWNNGRVDGRQRPRHPDLESVKRLLLS